MASDASMTEQHSFAKIYGLDLLFTVVCLGLAYAWGGWNALYVVVILCILEISLSFDNAVVNAGVLTHMSRLWQTLFLTVGILIAVFGMRLLFPVTIVAFAADQSFAQVVDMALHNPDQYSDYLHHAHVNIAIFGGAFLMLVFLGFLFDDAKETHWFGPLERALSRFGGIQSLPVLIVLFLLLVCVYYLPTEKQAAALISGLVGVLIFGAIHILDDLLLVFTGGEESGEAGATTKAQAIARNGMIGFLYLEVLDASFSLDGVVGAFAITRDVVIIMIGLAVGAFYVRSMTIMLVRKGTLKNYLYLEHGAHYAIGLLASLMLVSAYREIPEWLTGTGGLVLILWSLWSSLRHRKATPQP